ncbi:uncharacterized protein ARMOST_20363 [Armillaria ostoyae]|uniref:Retrotransposon gag domain-containing protein n=1 Tax=Armillaria ostoyae TaxID=47428 RepID=A0A284S766_ARMOS|nr:uncharacterized protein ARMOST_20363 [Armillaria ostoyae]
MSPPHNGRNYEGMMFQEPLLPLDPPRWRNMRGTFGLATKAPCHPIPLPPPVEQWYPANLVSGWTFPIPVNPCTPPDKPLPTFPPTTRIATPTPRTPLLPSEEEEEPQSLSSERMITPSTPTALTTSGQPSLPSTDKSLVPTKVRHESSEEGTLRVLMDYYLTMNQGYPLPHPNQNTTIEARIFANRDRALFNPSAGARMFGHALEDALYLGIKPILFQPPKLFKGDHNNIEWFLGDCIAYFEVFQSYFHYSSQMVSFAISFFKGPAKDWWVYKRQEFWSHNGWDTVPAWFQYLEWEEFIEIINTQFQDPMIEEVYEKRMFDLWMGNMAATLYFQKLEEEAKLAGLWTNEREHRAMVKITYSKWKAQIVMMYKERQKKWVFNQTVGIPQDSRPPQNGPSHTPTSTSQKAGGVTSLSSNKPTSDTPSPPSLGPVQKNLKGLSQLPARAQEKVAEPAGHGAESPKNNDHDNTPRAAPSQVQGPRKGRTSDPLRPEEAGRIDQPKGATRIQPAVPVGDSSFILDWQVLHDTPLRKPDKDT